MSDNKTIELREKLTERGVEYTTNDYMGACVTSCNGFTAIQISPSAKLTMVLTPEQAIAAMLGSEECELSEIDTEDTASEWMCNRWWVFDSVYKCSCGKTFGYVAEERPNFCPNCGKVVKR